MLELATSIFKSAEIAMLKLMKKTVWSMCEKGNNKQTEFVKNKNKNSANKENTVSIIQYLMYENNNKINITEEGIHELEDRSIAIIQFESERKRKGKKRLNIREK